MSPPRPLSVIARLMWLAPTLLAFLTVYLTWTALELRTTWQEGVPATAEVVRFKNTERSEITYGYLNLRIPLPDGTVLVREQHSLPNTLIPRVAEQQELAVHVRPDAAQPVVIDRLMPAHFLIAAVQALVCGVGVLLLGWAVYAWNAYLRRRGDPAEQRLDGPEPHPASQVNH